MPIYPAVDPIPLPAPVWLLKLLHDVTLALHFVAVEMLLGGLLLAILLSLFSGSPHGSEGGEDLPMPPQIYLYLESLWEVAEGDLKVFQDEVKITYLHELGHYLGWDEDDLADRGLD